MLNTDFCTRITAEVDALEPDAQRRVLRYVLALKKNGKGMSGSALKRHIGTISATDAKSMVDAIEAGCELQ